MKTREHWFRSHVQEMTAQECLEALDAQEVGRVAFVDGKGPIALPVNFVMDGGTVLFATAFTSSLARHVPGHTVAFQADYADSYTESGWSVVIRGRAEMVPSEELPVSEDRPRPWAEGTRPLVIRISPEELTGRRLVPA